MLNRIKLMTIIVNYYCEDNIIKNLKKKGISNYVIKKAIGTASDSVLDYFGLDEIKKNIIFTIIPEYLEYTISVNLEKTLSKPGTGIAYTIPITSSNRFLTTENQNMEVHKMPKSDKSLIITITNEGYYEEIMNVAKKNGASGGTIIRGKGLKADEMSKMLGININPEKDIILIVVNNKEKINIMEKINEKFNMNDASKGICFSVPIDTAIGFVDDLKELQNGK